jgi:hypothetical protein
MSEANQTAGGATSLLTDNPGGQQGEQGGGQASGQGGAQGGQQQQQQKTWRDDLPEEIKNDPALSVIHDIPSLAKSYIHGQKAIGADKAVIPGKNATDEDWSNFYKKIGVPELDKYEITKLEGMDDALLSEFKKTAHGAGLLPKQTEKVLSFYSEIGKKALKAQEDAKVAKVTEGVQALRKEWGEGYDKEVSAARVALTEFADEETIKHIRESGMGNDPKLIKLFNKVGKALAEDKIKGDTGGAFNLTPQEIGSKITDMMADKNGAYRNKNHPGHAQAVKDMENLFKAQAKSS